LILADLVNEETEHFRRCPAGDPRLCNRYQAKQGLERIRLESASQFGCNPPG
jgi:hypothetical protein